MSRDANDGPTVEEAFHRTAGAVGGEVHAGFGFGPRVQKRVRDWILTLERVRTENGGVHTRLRAPYRTSEPFRFEMRDVRRIDDFLETLGFLQDITVGDVELDRRFVIKGAAWAKVRGLFVDPRLREILRTQPAVHLRTTRFPVYGPPYVTDLWELHFREPGEITDVRRLTELFELFGILLPRLCPESEGWEGDLERLVDRLLGSGAQVVDPPGQMVVWDGGVRRRDAAERLGRLGDPAAVAPLLSVLDDADDELVAQVVVSLGRLGDADAVGPLVRLLGERRRRADGGVLSEVAGQALEALGRDDLRRAFERALEGDVTPLGGGGYRDEGVAALLTVLGASDYMAAADAARALGALGAREAVPLLRSKSRGWGMKTTLTEACEAALQAIDSRSGLPRPAAPAESGEETLPRPAEPSGDSGDTLPRPVDDEDRSP